jgi:hypothetical protein
MTCVTLTRLIFRAWVRAHPPTLTLGELRPLWRESRRFATAGP